MANQKSKYAQKYASGNMMYGPAPKVPKYPDFRKTAVPSDEYWWGELRRKYKSSILTQPS